MMMYTRKTYRLGTTAIAAVFALSPTQLFAQEATSTEQPVVESPAPATMPATGVAAPAPAADPLAPVEEPESASTEATAVSAAPADAKATAKSAVKKPIAKTARISGRAAAPAATPIVPDPKPTVDPTESSDSSPLESMKPAEIAAVPNATPVEKPKLDEAVPLAGGAGAVALALMGAGIAIRRRKRHDEEEILEEEAAAADQPLPEPEPRWEPPIVEPVVAATKPVPDTTSELPADFNTAKFGRHVQAAYRGPTPENPSLSLRKRLKIAGELDRRERKVGNTAAAREPVAATGKAPQRMAFSFSGTPFEQKWPEKQF